nr:hypothetical protein [Tanacetum cinerariifolium]
AHGWAPIEDGSPVKEVATPAKAKKFSKSHQKTVPPKEGFKTSPWTIAEEVALCQAWCDVSKNKITGNAMKSKGFLLKRNESGSCDLTAYQKACVEYAAEYDHEFTLEPYGSEEEVREVRPMGQDRTKKKSSTSSHSEASSAVGGGIVETVADKWKSFKATSWGKRRSNNSPI